MENLKRRQPTVFINHGGGPRPILGQQPEIVSSLQQLSKRLARPRAIVIISAHFESPGNSVSVMTGERPPMLYDYNGFPAQAYSLRYPACIDTRLTDRVVQMLKAGKIEVRTNAARGFDHGVFVPLMIMYPEADIPLVVVSIPASGSTSVLTAMGHAIAPLREENVLILGSGASFHNFSALFRPSEDTIGAFQDTQRAKVWDEWLNRAVKIADCEQRTEILERWCVAPEAEFANPTHDHLSPLLVVSAAGGDCMGKLTDKCNTEERTPLLGSQFSFGPLPSVDE